MSLFLNILSTKDLFIAWRLYRKQVGGGRGWGPWGLPQRNSWWPQEAKAADVCGGCGARGDSYASPLSIVLWGTMGLCYPCMLPSTVMKLHIPCNTIRRELMLKEQVGGMGGTRPCLWHAVIMTKSLTPWI